ncbi:MAG: zinc-dependent alcohol dehydrogenase family protein [Armatimonadota bacterium]|nr:zinc-dependent alcohol dehydrogenase family protein [Armatimonadota bacterium]
MKAVVFTEPGKFIVTDRPVPQMGPGDLLLKVDSCGVCGTDIHIFHGEHFVEFPVIPGHEYSGVVVEAGSEVKYITIGDHVAVDPNIVCGVCHFCRRGQIHLCEKLTALGVNMDGGFAEYSLVPGKQAYLLPKSLPLEHAALVEPLACCVHGIDQAEIGVGDDVLVIGAGPIGLIMTQLARLAGARRVIVSEPSETRRELAAELGADIVIDPINQDLRGEVLKATEVGAGVVIECVGKASTAEQAIGLAKRGGMILLFGVTSPGEESRIKPYDVFFRELTIRGSFINPFTHARAVNLLAEGKVNVEPLISHRLRLEDFGKALALAGTPAAAKILIKPGD